MKNLLYILAIGLVLYGNDAKAQVPPAERAALQDLYNATGGPTWASETDGDTSNNWDFDGPVTNNWHGIEVRNGNIYALYLRGNQLAGSIPQSIGNLTGLVNLHLEDNQLTGNIPRSITSFSNLGSLYLRNNQLTGGIPPDIGSLTNLLNLFLDGNQLTGTIPSSIGSLQKLVFLSLSTNQLSGTIPETIGSMTDLGYLYLHSNQISGTLPNSFGNLTNLVQFDLYRNQVTGTIPETIASLTKLEHVNFSNNRFNGVIPANLGFLTKLEYVNFSNNGFSGTIPQSIGSLTSLNSLNLGGNQLTGSLPNSLMSLGNLKGLYLSGNQFTGTIPNLSTLPNFEVFFIRDNNFQFGDFETQFGDYSGLASFPYSPQSKIGTEETREVANGDPVTLTATVRGSRNHYQWFKDNTAIAGAPDSATYTLSAAKASDAGTYYCKITSDIVTGLTLQRSDIVLDVTGEDPTCTADDIRAEWSLDGGQSYEEATDERPVAVNATAGNNVRLSMMPNNVDFTVSRDGTELYSGGTDLVLGVVAAGDAGAYLITSETGCTTTIDLTVADKVCSPDDIRAEWSLDGGQSYEEAIDEKPVAVNTTPGSNVRLSMMPNNLNFTISRDGAELHSGRGDLVLGTVATDDSGAYLITSETGCTTTVNLTVADVVCTADDIRAEWSLDGGQTYEEAADEKSVTVNTNPGSIVRLSMMPNNVNFTVSRGGAELYSGGTDLVLGAVATGDSGTYLITSETGCTTLINLVVEGECAGEMIPEYRLKGVWGSGENDINLEVGEAATLSMLPNNIAFTITKPDGTVVEMDYSIAAAQVSDSGPYLITSEEGCTTTINLTVGDGIVVVPPQSCDLTVYPYRPPTLSDGNYIHTRSYQTDGTINNAGDVIESVTYFDGLGRPMQQIGIGASAERGDMITHIGYDGYGRRATDHLPYAAGGALGSLRGGASAATNTYYQANYGDPNSFAEKAFEPSPLNRVVRQGAPGEPWRVDGGHAIEFEYATNTADDAVIRFDVTTTLSGGVYVPTQSSPGNYAPGELYKNITKDENHSGDTKNHTTEEFTDKQGRTVLKRTYADIPGTAQARHDTYYLYDDFGNLTRVFSPKMEGALPNIAALGYEYRYDHRNRLVTKKLPGKGLEYIIYNNLDQPIMTKSALQRLSGEWLFTKYDAFGRVAQTGKVVDNRSHNQIQSEANNYTGKLWVDRAGTNYDNGGYPNGTNIEVLTENFYDDYDFDRAGAPTSAPLLNTPGTSTAQVKGLATGSRVKVLGASGNNWITTVTLYDDKARPVYVHSNNDYLATVDITKMEVDFAGRTQSSETTHTRNGISITTFDTYGYDHMGRQRAHTQKIDDGPETAIACSTYDDLGQLTSKIVGGGLQTVDYAYNIRGWLTNINEDENEDDNDLFDFGIGYQDSGVLFNGNISQTRWKTLNDDQDQRSYDYTYDPLNRITAATDNTGKFNVSGITYDKNGNIQKLKREGWTSASPSLANNTGFGTMDDLTYSYDSGNKLMKVADAAAIDQYGFKDDAVNTAADSSDDYVYDPNGNMTRDDNKGITGITYNHLNLPEQVTFNSGNIQYVYSADGAKLKKTVSTTGTETLYANGYLYEGNVLQFFPQPEGYVSVEGGNYEYVYNYSDHLGNIRLSYTDANNDGEITTDEIVKESNYFPFGLAHRGYNGNVSPLGNSVAKKYMFGGKEYQDELNLGWYDISARNYDPALGRWMNLDPLAEQMRRHSPYNFGFDNPIYFQDYDGMKPQGPCGDKPCPEEQDNMPPDARAAKNYFDNLFTNVLDSVDDIFSSDDSSSSSDDSSGDAKITTDGLQIFGVGGDSEAGSGIVTGNDRGDGKPIEAPLLGKNAFNKVLDIAVTIGITVAVVSFDTVFWGSDDSQADKSTMESSNEESTSSSEQTTIRLQTKDPSFGYDSSNGQIINSTGTSFRDTTINVNDVERVTRFNDSIENKKVSDAYKAFRRNK